jgi:hypothetical protein
MIYTGQTGWMQGSKYGFIFDTTLNDFISGEIEHAIVSCWKDTYPMSSLSKGSRRCEIRAGLAALSYSFPEMRGTQYLFTHQNGSIMITCRSGAKFLLSNLRLI